MARDAVGTCCHLAKRDGFNVLVKLSQQFSAVFSTSRQWIQLKLSHVTLIVSFFIIWPTNQHYVEKKKYKSMTLPIG